MSKGEFLFTLFASIVYVPLFLTEMQIAKYWILTSSETNETDKAIC